MGRHLRVLIIEDSEDDTQLILRELWHIGYDVEFERVESAAAMQVVLTEKTWDLILSDYTMPRFNALQALEVLKASHLDLPFIIISGTIGEETAVAALKAGANDFLIKGKFARLGQLIERELLEAKTRYEHKRAEEAVLESEARYHRVLDAMMEGCQIIDFDWRYVYVNDVVAEQGKHKREELLGHTIMEVYPGIENTELFAALRQCMEERTPKRMENQFVFPDGSIGWFELSIQPAEEGIFILSTDITERKRAADQLKYHARLLRHINDAVIATDDQFRITAWNRAAERMYGWHSEEVIGRNVSDTLSSKLSDEQRAETRKRLKESNVSRGESVYHRKDGRTIYVEENTIALTDEYGKFTGYVSVHRDITERKRAEEQTQFQLQRLKALRAIDIAISSSFDLHLTLNILLDQVIVQLNVDAAAILLFQPITKTLIHGASCGFRTTNIRESRVRLGEGYAGRAVLERRTIHIPNLTEAGSEFTRAPLINSEDFVDYYGVPLIVKGEVQGVLEIFHRSTLIGDTEWLDFLETLAGQAAIAVENATLFENLQRSNQELFQAYDATIEGWSHALDLRDKETEGHTQRVTEMTLELARKFGFMEEQLINIRWGALLHDIGKMGVPDNILLKPDKLTDEEWERMKKHPTFALEMLSPIGYLKSSLDIPYCHHEKWDGTGYPRGLNGEVIPLAARLFAVVDVWDALRSDRPYRKGWTVEETIEHIRSQAGSHFDPKVVEKFLDLIGQSNG